MWLKSFDNRIFSYTQYFLLQHTNLSPNSFLEIFLCLVISYLSLKLSRNYSFPLLYTLLIILPLQFLHHQENNNLHLYFYLFCSIFFFSLWVRRIAYFFFFSLPPPPFFFPFLNNKHFLKIWKCKTKCCIDFLFDFCHLWEGV